jgi:hypothetical protein
MDDPGGHARSGSLRRTPPKLGAAGDDFRR